MGSSSSSRSSRLDKSPWATVRDWCGQHRYLVLAGSLGGIALGVISVGNHLASTTVVTDETADEEFRDLGLEDAVPVESDPPARSKPGFTAVTAVRPAPTGDFADLTLNLGHQAWPSSGVVSAGFEGGPQPPLAAPVWLAGTIETDDDAPAFNFPSSAEVLRQQATGPILTPQ